MGNVVRLGDRLDCGSKAAQGSPTVFVNGKPVSTQTYKATTGHECNPPSFFVGPFTVSVFVENAPVTTNGAKGPPTSQEKHKCTALYIGHQGHAAQASPNVSFDA
jgi:hypothetical protein